MDKKEKFIFFYANKNAMLFNNMAFILSNL